MSSMSGSGLSPDELVDAVAGAAALIIRSATTVTARCSRPAPTWSWSGGPASGSTTSTWRRPTERGVMVVNAPQSNILSAAEHTMALLLAQARNIPQAHAALVDGRWERSRWEGVELSDKTLGVVGLGRIGKLVAQRAHAFGMRLVAYDPFVSEDRARQLGVELVTLDRLVEVSDFVTLHVAKTPETVGLIGKDLLARAKPGIRIINVARGGIVDEEALAEAIRVGHVGGAAVDVFAAEPTTESPLFGLPQVVVTPHLGASTREAQDKAGDTIAEQVGLALAGEFVPFAVNVSAAEASETVRHFLPLAERLGADLHGAGRGAAQGAGDRVRRPDRRLRHPDPHAVGAEGRVRRRDRRAGVVRERAPDRRRAGRRGPRHVDGHRPRLREPHLDPGRRPRHRRHAGGPAGRAPGSSMLDGHTLDLPPASHMLVVRNDDRPGMIAYVAGVLAEAGVNIDDMHLGRSNRGEAALQVIATDRSVPPEVQDAIRQGEGIVSVHAVG